MRQQTKPKKIIKRKADFYLKKDEKGFFRYYKSSMLFAPKNNVPFTISFEVLITICRMLLASWLAYMSLVPDASRLSVTAKLAVEHGHYSNHLWIIVTFEWGAAALILYILCLIFERNITLETELDMAIYSAIIAKQYSVINLVAFLLHITLQYYTFQFEGG